MVLKRISAMTLFVFMASVFCYGGDEVKKESDGFQWTLQTTDSGVMVGLDANGKEIMPAERGYLSIQYVPYEKDKYYSIPPFFIVSCSPDTSIVGACNTKGEEIVPVEYKLAVRMEFNKKMTYYLVMTVDSLYGVFDENGRMLVSPRYYNSMPIVKGDRFIVNNLTTDQLLISDLDNSLVSFSASNSLKDYYAQQKLLTEAISKNVNTDELLLQAIDLESAGDTKKAIEKLTAAIKLKPSSLAYYHRGNCYYQNKDWNKAQEDLHYVFFLDDATPQLQMLADSVLTLADEAVIGRKLRNRERFNRFAAVIDAISGSMEQNAYLLNGNKQSQTHASTSITPIMSSTSKNTGSVSNNTQNAKQQQNHNRRCSSCGGDGKCRGTYHCRGTMKCNYCNGSGFTSVVGNNIKCVNCNGSGKCYYCKGTGRCNRCGGRGTL